MSYVSDHLNGRSVEDILNDEAVTSLATTLAQDGITLDGFQLDPAVREALSAYTDKELATRAVDAFVELALRRGLPASIVASQAAKASQVTALENLTEIHQALDAGVLA